MNTKARVPSFLLLFTTGISLTCAHAPVPPYIPSELCQADASPGGAADPLLIEDAENGDDQVVIHDGRDGHGLRRTFNNLSRQVAGAIVTRAITGHVTEEMTEHYSHVDRAEKLRAADQVVALAGLRAPANDTAAPNAPARGGSGGGLN